MCVQEQSPEVAEHLVPAVLPGEGINVSIGTHTHTDRTHLRRHNRGRELELRHSDREAVDSRSFRPDFGPENLPHSRYLVPCSDQSHPPHRLWDLSRKILTFSAPVVLCIDTGGLVGRFLRRYRV